MNVYEYFNSKDIADHCKNIGHTFTAIETAYLIWYSDHHTIAQKHNAWKHIIETMPDEKSTQFGSSSSTMLGNNAFTGHKMKKVYLPDSVIRIEDLAFPHCDKLEYIIGNGVQEIEIHAFHGCEKLEKVVFPSLKKYIDLAFVGCDNLEPENMLFPTDAVAIKTHLQTCACLGSQPIKGKIHVSATTVIDG